ncbi:mCG126467, partial [Mus musculus]
LGQTRPDTRPASSSRQRPLAGTARKGKGPLGRCPLRHPPPFSPRLPPDPSNPKPTPASLLEEAPESRRLVRVCVHPTAALRTPKWRPGLKSWYPKRPTKVNRWRSKSIMKTDTPSHSHSGRHKMENGSSK